MQSKDKILEQTGQITAGMLETIQKQTLVLDTNKTQSEQMGTAMIGEKEELALLGDTEWCLVRVDIKGVLSDVGDHAFYKCPAVLVIIYTFKYDLKKI